MQIVSDADNLHEMLNPVFCVCVGGGAEGGGGGGGE